MPRRKKRGAGLLVKRKSNKLKATVTMVAWCDEETPVKKKKNSQKKHQNTQCIIVMSMPS